MGHIFSSSISKREEKRKDRIREKTDVIGSQGSTACSSSTSSHPKVISHSVHPPMFSLVLWQTLTPYIWKRNTFHYMIVNLSARSSNFCFSSTLSFIYPYSDPTIYLSYFINYLFMQSLIHQSIHLFFRCLNHPSITFPITCPS